MFWRALKSFAREEDGPTSVEYALMVALIILALYSTIQYFGGANDGVWARNNQELENKVWPK